MSVAFATIDNNCFDKYLGKCDLDVIVKKADRPQQQYTMKYWTKPKNDLCVLFMLMFRVVDY